MNNPDFVNFSAEVLKSSPVFNMSLGSKELFHSNIWAWMMENFKEDAGKFFSPFLDGFNGEAYSISKVEREKENADLVITFSNGKKLVIENKIKSLPNIMQLESYGKKKEFSDSSFLLLTLDKSDFQFLPNIEQEKDNSAWYFAREGTARWKLRTYDTVLEFVRVLKATEPQPYFKSILEDYEIFVDQLLKLGYSIHANWSNQVLDVNTLEINTYRDLRIADLFLKRRYDLMRWNLISKLKDDPSLKFQIRKEGSWQAGKQRDVFFESGFTNGDGLMGFKFVVENNSKLFKALVLGVQIQGTSFRMNIESFSKGSDSLYRIALSLKEKGLWFDFSYVKELTNNPNAKIAGKSHKKEFPEFANYSESFFYNYTDISGLKLEQVLDCLKKACNQISENLPLIQAELK